MKKILSYLKSGLSNFSRMCLYLTHTVNFGIRSAFIKGPGSAFSDGSGPGPGPLYKVCPLLSSESRKRYKLKLLLMCLETLEEEFSYFPGRHWEGVSKNL